MAELNDERNLFRLTDCGYSVIRHFEKSARDFYTSSRLGSPGIWSQNWKYYPASEDQIDWITRCEEAGELVPKDQKSVQSLIATTAQDKISDCVIKYNLTDQDIYDSLDFLGEMANRNIRGKFVKRHFSLREKQIERLGQENKDLRLQLESVNGKISQSWLKRFGRIFWS